LFVFFFFFFAEVYAGYMLDSLSCRLLLTRQLMMLMPPVKEPLRFTSL